MAAKNSLVALGPLQIVAKEIESLVDNMTQLLGSGQHPSLDLVARYYTQAGGKRIRPAIVLLMSAATSTCPKRKRFWKPFFIIEKTIDSSLSLNDIMDDLATFSAKTRLSRRSGAPPQRRLAEITELVHTASLLHDDVIDHSISRRGCPSANVEFGNSTAVLAGDHPLARASVALARLRNAEVAELFATVLTNLVQGEFMQIKNTQDGEHDPFWSPEIVAYYLEKTHCETPSLISKSCRAAAILPHGSTSTTVEAAYAYGKNLGLAFQLIDDLLDYTRTDDELGKPSGADLELGFATTPLLFAWKTHPELGALIGRRFVQEGDVQMQSNGIEQTRSLAEEYCRQIIAAPGTFPDSGAKQGLVEMALLTLQRKM
ncbi:hypothetical protein PspLS_08460 [Pyricularia sp. CBS 133598]|nr:hypothetical protein PspLS_08460 [Pyricularia sp. CBS 133598]